MNGLSVVRCADSGTSRRVLPTALVAIGRPEESKTVISRNSGNCITWSLSIRFCCQSVNPVDASPEPTERRTRTLSRM